MQGGKEKRRDITIHRRELQYTHEPHLFPFNSHNTRQRAGSKEDQETKRIRRQRGSGGNEDQEAMRIMQEAKREDATRKII